ncbi:hemerythrin domain-containing protein [Deinococcus sp. NW-56]|uniref:hemerythrin domain-containing protein n=1 Tax=Deinococcus sp. NW-56 TaxID=2080419 RepID=UPI001319CA1E|nr:hemerythrin domain-containing protein [Deinococcus sp. NW-56]
MSTRSCSSVPPPQESPCELESAGAGPLVAALNRLKVGLEALGGASTPPCPERVRVQRVWSDLADGVETHLLKEDVMFLPALHHLAAGRPAQVPLGLHLQGPIDLLREEHTALLGSLDDGLALLEKGAPGLSLAERQTLQSHAAALGHTLRDHIQLQEEVLFPRVLAGTGSAL